MKFILFTIMLLLPLCVFSQTGKKKAFYFFDSLTKQPIQDVMAKDYTGTDTTTYVSNSRGQIVIPQSLHKLHTNHLNYRDIIVSRYNNKVLLSPSRNIMATAVIENEQKQKGDLLRAIASPFTDVTSNMSHGNKAALFIPADKENSGKIIKSLKYEVVDVFGVKNLKYLPFKAAVFSVDTATGMPGREIFCSDIIKKEDNKKWVTIDVSEEKINMPKEGIFIVFEVLEYKYYLEHHQKRTIWSKVGRIDAAPTVRANMYNPNNPRKSYRFTSCTVNQDCNGEKTWYPVNVHYMMDIEFED